VSHSQSLPWRHLHFLFTLIATSLRQGHSRMEDLFAAVYRAALQMNKGASGQPTGVAMFLGGLNADQL
jgi:hypothetical protein